MTTDNDTPTTFGRIIAAARRDAGLSQHDLAARIIKGDGTPISPQYLNDIEHDRRNPPSGYFIGEFARILGLGSDWLFFVVGRLPPDLRDESLPTDQVERALADFRRSLSTKEGE